MDSIYDTSFMVLAAGTAAAGAVLSYISYYVWGRPAEAATPAPAPEETSPSADLRDEAPTKAPEFEQEPPSPRGKEKITSESGGLLAIPSGGSAILVSPIKERPRAPARTLPSRGHLKARPAIDPRSEFQKQLDEQATSAQQTESAPSSAASESQQSSSSSRPPAGFAPPSAGRGRGAPMGIGGQGMAMQDLAAARARMRKAEQ
ncbi:uncharacterized protein ACA1_116440 [Acanthamoeba castellanii str. Neff]|uniref:Transmembrane protein n=1 Tax=Acanthamoeba castellanii (strain ATCC 30010 / Neff) TaxID=1257118 RepID=L8H611_ACACF|nr:uncharacterized protein ACA1_116440 [Acanthamoeba castellanii str. Neff]ELR20173.1 hypothetical protein ACA1_116440 [Acanthamoeba castellanii str. Neff]